MTGESGTGNRWRDRRRAAVCARHVTVGADRTAAVEKPRLYRELGDIFAVKLPHNRWCGFKALRERREPHVASLTIRPVLLIDERRR